MRGTTPELLLVVVGFGNVSRRLLGLLDESAIALAFTWRLAGVCSRSRGGLLDPAGLDHRACLAAAGAECRGQARELATARTFLAEALGALRQSCVEGRVVLVETTVLDAERGEPATSHVRGALAAGAHVVTANKGPAAFAYHELAALADRAARAFVRERRDGRRAGVLAGR